MGIADSLPATAVPAPGTISNVAAARAAAKKFTSFFLQQSFESMFKGLGNDKLFGGGEGEAIYRSLLLQEYSKVAAQSGGLGIADAVQREILQAQETK
ncbi:MAG TPA: rod-binding protein [Stellaceae bacterium]|nr:rod-binding protein [Stellaceae bacterium]